MKSLFLIITFFAAPMTFANSVEEIVKYECAGYVMDDGRQIPVLHAPALVHKEGDDMTYYVRDQKVTEEQPYYIKLRLLSKTAEDVFYASERYDVILYENETKAVIRARYVAMSAKCKKLAKNI